MKYDLPLFIFSIFVAINLQINYTDIWLMKKKQNRIKLISINSSQINNGLKV